jgi:hypothetical protein
MWRNILPTLQETKDLINTQQREGVVNEPDAATSMMLFIGLANLSSSSHGPFTFLWLLHVPDASLSEPLPQESSPKSRFLKKITMLVTSMVKWRQGLRGRPEYRLRS